MIVMIEERRIESPITIISMSMVCNTKMSNRYWAGRVGME